MTYVPPYMSNAGSYTEEVKQGADDGSNYENWAQVKEDQEIAS